MAGLTSTFNPPPKSHVPKPLHFLNPQTLPVHLRLPTATTRFPSLSITFYARGGGGGGGNRGNSRSSKQQEEDDAALDIDSIRSDKVRLIDQQQNMLGIVAKSQAIQMADDAELDLVILSPEADPPVVRIMDYNKYSYEQQKKKRDQQKKSSASRMDLKELKMGYNIDVHDYSVRLRAAKKFLSEGDKVKIIVNLKGRENEFRKNAVELIRRFQADIGELAVEEAKNLRDRNMFLILLPNKVVVQKSQEPPRTKDTTEATEATAATEATEVSAGV